ncbi:MAG TPA: hypothetical protein VFI03_00060 [Solirubrobacterales bacterium]|nr:hypothetical protein [Solirubrobacterales bacterium]
MPHALKSLGAAFVAVLALGAVAASSASASAFTSTVQPTITGNQISGTITGVSRPQNEFTTKAGTVKCSTVTFHGVTISASELTLTPTLSGCFLGGVVPVHVKMNGCDYLVTAGEAAGESIEATTHIDCSPGNLILIEATGSTCKITTPDQTLGGITFHNSGTAEAMDVQATTDAAGITYEVHGSCPNSPTGTTLFHDGTYRGVGTLKSSDGDGLTVH